MRLREWGREGEGEMETGLFGPLRPAWAGQLREKFLLPTQTGMTHVAAIATVTGAAAGILRCHRCRSRPPIVRIASVTRCCLHVCTSVRSFFSPHESSETCMSLGKRIIKIRDQPKAERNQKAKELEFQSFSWRLKETHDMNLSKRKS